VISSKEYQFLLRNDLVSFIERSFYELNPQTRLLMADYIELMASKLEECRTGRIRRLIINLPPRYLKSHCASISFVAWLLGHDPAAQIICASYGQELADKLARDCRTVMSSAWYQSLFPTRILAEKRSVNDFMTTAKGFRMSTSVGGVLTGRGADMIIIDDPLKPDEALSETQRKSVNDWYDNTLLSRLNDKGTGCIMIIMQRLHQDDLVGHVSEQENWEIVNFPAIAEEDSSVIIHSALGKRKYTRKSGSALHPERESLDMLAQIRSRMGEYNFLSQYQQTPIPPGGAMVKSAWLKYYTADDKPSRFDFIVQSWDTASKVTELSDYSVCVTIGKMGDKLYLLNVFRRRIEFPDLKRAVREQANLYKPSTILIEDKSSGIQLIQDLKREGMHNIKPYDPMGLDKVIRLHVQTTKIENGCFLLPKEAHWLADYTQELLSFPGSKYDDQVDATTQALEWIPRRSVGILDVLGRGSSRPPPINRQFSTF